MEGVARSQLQAFAEGLGENHATGFIESQLSRHNAIMKWNNPFVNAIWAHPGTSGTSGLLPPTVSGAHLGR
jgi:hypothetical protein